jgi:CheY-like chemotaxis protein
VIDDGIGIAADKQARMFQPFHRAGQEAGPIEGTGIGLAITKRVVELMGGAVGFRSEQGAGSEFWLQLPMIEATRPPSSDLNRRPVESRLSGRSIEERYTVVYVEDNPSNIAFMESLIQDIEGIDLITAPTAEIGIELIRARQPHVVIMDINLPGISGFEATRRLKQWPETRAIPVIALSAAAMVHDQAHVNDAGFHSYLTKPVDVTVLTQTLEELLTK